MSAPGATLPLPHSHRRSETHEQRLLDAHANALAAISPPPGHPAGARPVGLLNEGNTCFFNSTFQALAATTSLIDLVGLVIFPPVAAGGTQKTDVLTAQSGASNGAAGTAELDGAVDPPVDDEPAKTYTTIATGSDGYALYTHSIPSLLDSALEPDNARLLPVTLAFEKCLGKAWKAKDESLKKAGVTGKDGKAEAEKEKTLSLKQLLKEVARKYDQYGDYRQQDAHELLRHLLDSMSMEEKDLIKIIQPPAPDISDDQASRSQTAPAFAAKRKRTRSAITVNEEGEEFIDGVNMKDRLIPFTDALFGGTLVSVVICEGCKSVSHTYEGFMDISLSVGNQQPRLRKRDKFKAMAQKFKPGSSGKASPGTNHSASTTPFLEGVHSPASTTDHEALSTADEGGGSYPREGKKPRTESLASTTFSMHSSTSVLTSGSEAIGSGGEKSEKGATLKKRASLTSWTGRRKARPSTASSVDSTPDPVEPPAAAKPMMGFTKPFTGWRSSETTPTTSRRGSAAGAGLGLENVGHAGRSHDSDEFKPPRPSPEQAAYIRRLLNGPNLPERHDDPLERLRHGMAQMQTQPQLQSVSEEPAESPALLAGQPSHDPFAAPTYIEGLDSEVMGCLKRFTDVEVLEDENAFACDRCWKYKTGRMRRRKHPNEVYQEPARSPRSPNPRDEVEDSSSEEDDDQPLRPAHHRQDTYRAPKQTTIPEIAITANDGPVTNRDVDADDASNNSVGAEDRPLRSSDASINSSTSEGDRLTVSSASISGYLTSSEDSDSGPHPVMSRPSAPSRRKSSHFVLQRAFKRYMIARAPPVLVLHMKRFQQSSKFSSSSAYASSFAALKKNDDFISFPEKLDLSPFMAPQRQDYKVVVGPNGLANAPYLGHPPGDKGPKLLPMVYRLYAVVVHLGSTALSGHYIAYVLIQPSAIIKTRNLSGSPEAEAGADCAEPEVNEDLMAKPNQGQHVTDDRVWCYCSDTQVRLASIEEVLKAKAYMCFYEKCA